MPICAPAVMAPGAASPTPLLRAPPLAAPAATPAAPTSMPMAAMTWARSTALAQAGEMAAGDMAGLVGHDADELVGAAAVENGAGIDEDAAAIGDEGVEGAAVDDDDVGLAAADIGDAEQRPGIVAQQILDLGVADDRQAARHLRARRRNRQQAGQGRDGQPAVDRKGMRMVMGPNP